MTCPCTCEYYANADKKKQLDILTESFEYETRKQNIAIGYFVLCAQPSVAERV